MDFESQLKRIASKAALRALIDDLPDDAAAVLVTVIPSPTEETINGYCFPPTLSSLEIIGLKDVVRRYTDATVGMRIR